MNSLEHPSEKSTISEVDAILKRLLKNWASSKKARKDWDFKTGSQSLDSIREDIQQMATRWPDQEAVIREATQIDQGFVADIEQYAPAIETALREAGIPLRGTYPTYEFPPFKLSFSQETVRLALGRRSQQTKAFAPDQLAAWVAGQYKRVIESKFDSNRFCKELFNAYVMLNQLEMKTEVVQWGHPILLKDIYKLLTFRQSAKQDYPEPLFVFDLARLKEQTEIQYEDHAFELVPSREQSKNFILVNSWGQENRVGSLTIYDRENK
ncbi:MAG: hypothetical protein VKJ46_04095 [Leptolyngbyaceae bacterium]|nr:hypothetical protein [Leptolyngbyaceae bacterium]